MREKLKLYYRCRFTQLSPLRLSGGKNDRTDNDLMLDSFDVSKALVVAPLLKSIDVPV